jgi:2-polyprenyl-3-methyl-5-hydroxy-6-metoxy-1,4-benzoquinol methylase
MDRVLSSRAMDLQSAQTVLEKEVRKLYDVPEGVPVDELPEPKRTYVRYSLETLLRGRIAMDEIRPYRALGNARFLDAGCAYGGFLVAAAEAGAREVVGIDLDDRFLDIARPYLAASGMPHQVEKGDASDAAFMGNLGGFDLITCNDVIEHVDSVPQLVRCLAGATNEGGCVYIAAPNRMCPEFIRKDPHFQLFGIVLLPKESAMRYYASWSGSNYYDVGEYFELDFHRALIESHGLEFQVINVPGGPPRERVAELEREFQELETAGAAFQEAKLPEDLNAAVRDGVAAAVQEFRTRLARLRALDSIGDTESADLEAFRMVRDYAVPVWHIVARRPSQGGYRTESSPGFATKVRRKLKRLLQYT